MNPLYQRLRELDPDAFENLCFQIIAERHPGIAIEKVRGAGGDKGIDLFSGDLAGVLTVWQCKFFPNGIKSPQKIQIRKSLRTALKNFAPSRWILCVPIDLGINAHTWFQALRKENETRVDVGLFQASNIVRELIHRRSIRNMFFPGVVLDPDEIRSLLARTGEYTTTELERLNLENVQQYLRRLKDRDARFDYRLTYLPEQPSPFESTGQIVTISDENRRLDVFPRDVEALRIDPPRVLLTLDSSASEKLRKAIETGSEVLLGASEIKNVESTFDFLLPNGAGSKMQELWIGPSDTTKKKRLKFRVTFGQGSSAISYPLVEFKISKLGTKQVELTGSHEALPFEMSIAFPFPLAEGATATINITYKFAGHRVVAVKKFLDAMAALSKSTELELFDLEREKIFVRGNATFGAFLEAPSATMGLFENLAEVARSLSLDLQIPESLKPEDLEALPTYLELARCGNAKLGVANVSLTLVKDLDHEGVFLDALTAEGNFKIEFEKYRLPQLLGQDVQIGPGALVFEKTRIADPEKVRREYVQAQNGESIVVRLVPAGDVTLFLHKEQEQHSGNLPLVTSIRR